MGSICLQGGACLPPSCRRWSELAAAPPPPVSPAGGRAARHSPCVLHGGPAQTARGAGRACQPVSHLERAPAAAQTFQRGRADASPARGLGNELQAAPWPESVMALPSRPRPGHCFTLGGVRSTGLGPRP